MKCLSVFAALSLMLALPATAAPHEGDVIADKAEAMPTPYFMDLALSHLILCVTSTGLYVGTGESISATDIATANHIAASGKCSVDGKPVATVYSDKIRDFAVVRTAEHSPRRVTVSCAGFREGDDYFAVGWAQGTDFAVQRITGTSDTMKNGPWSLLRGLSFRGQSGGAVYDGQGRMVGIVNAGVADGTPWLMSLPMSETYLCPRSVASVDSGHAVR